MKLRIQISAELDVLREVERYVEQGVPDIAERFHASVMHAIDVLLGVPEAGAPKTLKNLRLEGLRTWPVNGFDAFRIYYLVTDDLLTVVRILHGKRDIGSILENEPEAH